MPKGHPIHQHDRNARADTQRARDFLKDHWQMTETDRNDRAEWEHKISHYQRRRYGQEWRNVVDPWPGSSEIVMPLEDKKIDEFKPQYVGIITSGRPPVTVMALDADSQRKTGNVELFYEWLIKWGSPQFLHEIVYCVDDLLETGRGILKTLWHYETQFSPETISRERLPPRLRRLVVEPGLSEKQIDEANALAQERGTGQLLISRKNFDQLREQILDTVKFEFQLDDDETRDRAAIVKVMDWFQSGAKEPLTFEKRDVMYSAPGVVAVSPIDFLVPESTTSIATAARMTHVMRFSATEIRRRVRDAGWSASAVEELLKPTKRTIHRSRASGDRNTDMYRLDQIYREGRANREDETFEIYESCIWYANEKNGPERKHVLLWAEGVQEPLKWYQYSRPSGRWPYHTATFEENKRGWYSPRGVPEKLSDLAAEITFEHRAKLNRMAIANSPTFFYRPNRGLNPENFQWIPGQFYPVQDPTDVIPVQVPNVDVSFEREEQILRTWAEEYLGGVDFGIANPLGSLTEPRTATEIRGIQNRANQALSLRGTLFTMMMDEVWQEMFDLWHTWGPQDVWVKVTQDTEPIKLTKESLQGRFFFQTTGTIGTTDPQVESQKALARMMVLLQIAQAGVVNETHELNFGEMVEDWLEKEDVRVKRRILRARSPEEIQQIRQAAAQRQQLAERALTNQEMSPEELEQALGELGKRAPFGKAQRVSR